MNERDRGANIPPTEVVRTWMVEELVGKGICPPLARLVHTHSIQGSPDWNALARVIDIQDLHSEQPTRAQKRVQQEYVKFLSEAVNDTTHSSAPLTKVWILPDFAQNSDYDQFVRGVKKETILALRKYPNLVRNVLMSVVTASDRQIVRDMLQVGERGMEAACANIVEGAFNMVYFYGKDLDEQDMRGFSNARGPVERTRVLSRAPYYMLQVVNSIGSKPFTEHMDRSASRKRNTDYALGQTASAYGLYIDSMRRGK